MHPQKLVPDAVARRLRTEIRRALPEAVRLRRYLHTRPELSGEELETTKRVLSRLRRLRLQKVRTYGGVGATAVLRGKRRGPRILLRAELDGLPIRERTGVRYASKNPGVMHACGHDGHMSILLATARVLSRMRDNIAGSVLFLFQPAEEGVSGARYMIRRGALSGGKIAAAFALHNFPDREGMVLTRPGAMMAADDVFTIAVEGRASHGARPDRSHDPLLAAAAMVVDLQAVVAREVSPFAPVVLTVGAIRSGAAHNQIPGEAAIRGTIRTLDASVRKRAREALERRIRSVAAAHRVRAKIEYPSGTDELLNDPAMTDYFARVATEAVGKKRVRTDAPQLMGSEDFAVYLKRIPGVMFRLGAGRGKGTLHTPTYDFNDAIIPLGVELFCRLVLAFPAR